MTDLLKEWISPDKKIIKQILTSGSFGAKPTENSICTIEVTKIKFKSNSMLTDYLVDYSRYPLTLNIGEANTAVDREIEKCLGIMLKDEISSVTLAFPDNEVSFVLKLCHFESRGFIYEWDAQDKCMIAQKHKEQGIELFKQNRYVDASHRFSRGLKLVLSIPIPIENTPNEIDGIILEDIDKLKANLYNNLASCYSKEKLYDTVIELCCKVLDIEENNVKALHKRGFAYAECRNFDKAHDDLTKLLILDAGNQAAKEKLQFVISNISKQEANYASIVKNMFRN